ncbi:hypothetical protein [Thermicanus aegyptius]|uniref:hypothetical protein n=1 Tax=Thermicanus aegyptius TaxID=94009 RepID=UPI00041537B9|nr:hypothetical protein [Thermicanus aegyptius]
MIRFVNKIKKVIPVNELDNFGKKMLKDLSNHERNADICKFTSEDIQKAIEIISRNAYGRFSVQPKCDVNQKKTLFMKIDFINRKGKVALKVRIDVDYVRSILTRKTFFVRKKIIGNKIYTDLFYNYKLKDVVELMLGYDRFHRLRIYLAYRIMREELFKAAKWGIDVSEIKENLKENLKKYFLDGYFPEEKEITFINFEEPFLLVGGYRNNILYTPFGKHNVNRNTTSAREAFKKFVNINRMPSGKNALKKIEALLLQASL